MGSGTRGFLSGIGVRCFLHRVSRAAYPNLSLGILLPCVNQRRISEDQGSPSPARVSPTTLPAMVGANGSLPTCFGGSRTCRGSSSKAVRKSGIVSRRFCNLHFSWSEVAGSRRTGASD